MTFARGQKREHHDDTKAYNCVNYIGLKSDLNVSRLGVKNPIEFMDHNKARMDGNTKQLYNVCVEM